MSNKGLAYQPPGHAEACVLEYIRSLAEALIQNDWEWVNKKVCISLNGAVVFISPPHDAQDNLIQWVAV